MACQTSILDLGLEGWQRGRRKSRERRAANSRGPGAEEHLRDSCRTNLCSMCLRPSSSAGKTRRSFCILRAPLQRRQKPMRRCESGLNNDLCIYCGKAGHQVKDCKTVAALAVWHEVSHGEQGRKFPVMHVGRLIWYEAKPVNMLRETAGEPLVFWARVLALEARKIRISNMRLC
jgi:hypothetical protein